MEKEKESEAFDLLGRSKVEKCLDLETVALPLGFHFSPEDRDLLLFFLTNKILNRTLPVDIIITLPDLYGYDPNMLVHEKDDGTDNQVFYFTRLQQHHKQTILPLLTGDWVQSRTPTPVYLGPTLLGFRKNRYFRRKKPAPPVAGDAVWVVNELSLNIDLVPHHLLDADMRKLVGSWVVCRIYKIILDANSQWSEEFD